MHHGLNDDGRGLPPQPRKLIWPKLLLLRLLLTHKLLNYWPKLLLLRLLLTRRPRQKHKRLMKSPNVAQENLQNLRSKKKWTFGG